MARVVSRGADVHMWIDVHVRSVGTGVSGAYSQMVLDIVFFFSSRRRHTRSVSAFLLNRSSDLHSFPSECHADYFDFERIEALKPAIEACGISTLSQSPMLGFHKQMDNRIKLLEEILSFRMQGVEFDNGDMYVDRSEERRVGKECRSRWGPDH